MNTKEKCRRVLHRRVVGLRALEKIHFSMAIFRKLAMLIRHASRPPRRIFAFAPTSREPNLRPLYQVLLRRGMRIAFPKVEGTRLGFYLITSLNDLRPGAYGIPEPVTGRKVGGPRQGDMILVPCVGLAPCGHRLGHGGGYYDRWLRKNPRGWRVAVLFHCQRMLLPHTPRDEQVHACVTERGIYHFD